MTIRKHIDLIEGSIYGANGAGFEDEEEIARQDERMERERKIEKLIRIAFQRIGLTINTEGYAVYYDDNADREATVKLEDDAISIKALARLYETGLSSEYQIVAGQHVLEIRFKVEPSLDSAVL